MLIKTRSSGLVWVEWPPVEDAEVWCRGPAQDGCGASRVYRLVEGHWVEGTWEDVEHRERDCGGLH